MALQDSLPPQSTNHTIPIVTSIIILILIVLFFFVRSVSAMLPFIVILAIFFLGYALVFKTEFMLSLRRKPNLYYLAQKYEPGAAPVIATFSRITMKILGVVIMLGSLGILYLKIVNSM